MSAWISYIYIYTYIYKIYLFIAANPKENIKILLEFCYVVYAFLNLIKYYNTIMC